jgi:chromate transporter
MGRSVNVRENPVHPEDPVHPSYRLLSLLRTSRLVASILDGVTVGSLALMAVVTWQLGRAAVVDVVTAMLAIGSAVLLLRFRLNSTWLIVAGAGVGTILGIVRAP